MCQYRDIQGEVNAITKLDRHYYRLFGFFAMNHDQIWHNTPNPESCSLIFNTIHLLQRNNYLYSSFFAHFETLFRFIKPGFVNPSLLEEQGITLDKLLDNEAVGMAFPVDAKYFDGFPLTTSQPNKDIIGIQDPKQNTGTVTKPLSGQIW